MQCNTKASRRKTENCDGKNREFNYQSKEYFPSRSKKLPPNTEWVLTALIPPGKRLVNFAEMIQNTIPTNYPATFTSSQTSGALLLGNCPDLWYSQVESWYRCRHSFQVTLPCLLSNSSHLTNHSIHIKRLTAELQHWKEKVPQINLQVIWKLSLRDNHNKSQFLSWVTSPAFSSELCIRISWNTTILQYVISCLFTKTTVYPLILFHFTHF